MKNYITWGIFVILIFSFFSGIIILENIIDKNHNINLTHKNEDLISYNKNSISSIIDRSPSKSTSISRGNNRYNDDFHNLYNTQFNYSLFGGNLNYTGPIIVDQAAAPTFIDLDNDVDLDLIIGDVNGALICFENKGNSIEPIWKLNSTLFNGIDVGDYSIPTFEDLDDDNDFDLIIGEQDGTLNYYQNIGNSNFPIWNLDTNMFTGIDIGTMSTPVFADLNNDNDADLAIGAADGTLYYYENTGNNQNPIWTQDPTMFSGIDVGNKSSPCFADLDNDNDLDLIIGALNGGNIYYYKNTGNAISPLWTSDNSMFAGINFASSCKPTVSDLDNDNDFDLTVAEHSDGILYFFKNTGTSNSPVWTIDLTIFYGVDVKVRCKPKFADLDDDGDLDLTIGHDVGGLYYYENIGNAIVPNWNLNTAMYSGIPNGSNYAPAFADLDNDGDLDLALGNAGGVMEYYNNTGNSQNPSWTKDTNMFSSIDGGNYRVPTFSDLDNDGDYDLIVGDISGFIVYFENIGNSQKPIWNLNNSMFPGIDVGSYSKPVFSDLDLDNDLDLISGNGAGNILYFENIGTISSPDWSFIPEIFSSIHLIRESAPTFTDLDNDNDLDLIIGEGNSGGGMVHFYENIRAIAINVYLLNRNGLDGKTIYAKYQYYTFQINVSNNAGYDDLNKVILTLDYSGKNLTYCWSQDTKLFSELIDPYDYATLTTGSYLTDGKSNWTIDLNIIINWSYPDEQLHNIKISAFGKKAAPNTLIKRDFYHVENDLEFIGNLSVVREYQGNLSKGDWVKGNEKITWGGLKVVYENSTDIYPPDNEFNVTLSDSYNQFWNDTSSSGENISIISTNYNKTNLNELFKLNITGMPSYCDHSNITFPLKIDADNITFTDPTPTDKIWHTSNIVKCGITVNDIGGSNVSANSIDYSVSNNNGSDWSDWHSTGMIEDAQSIECFVNTELEDGSENLIRWRGKDAVGNGYINSDSFGLLVDTTNVSFHNPKPDSSELFAYTNVTCSIIIEDQTSGVNANTIEYSILKDGEVDWSEWISLGKTLNNNIIDCSITPAFNNGTENYIRWRAKDVAGNGYNVSEIYQIKIDTSIPLPTVKLLYPPDGSNVTTTAPQFRWELNYTGTDAITYNLYLDTNGEQITLVSEGQTETNFIPSPLNDRETYYWKVIPIINKVSGQCVSGTWSFTVNLSHTPNFGLELYAERNIITVEQGESSSINITIKNIGENKDTFILNFDSPVFGNDNIELDQTLIELSRGGTEIIQMQVNAPFDMTPSYYGCNINASSVGALDYGLQVFSNFDLFINVLESSVSYGVNLTLEKYVIEIEQGKSVKVNLFIKNIGTETDIFQLEVLSIDFNITNINVANNIMIDANNLENVYLNISVPKNQPVTTYKIRISVISLSALNKGQNIKDTKTLNLAVLESDSDDTSEDLSFLLWVILIIAIIIIILFVFIKTKKSKKEDHIPSKQPEPEISAQQSQPPQVERPHAQKSTTEVIPVKSQSPASIVKQPIVEDNSISEKEIEE